MPDPSQMIGWLYSQWVHVAIGIGLAAASGFKVFLPFLGLSAAVYSGVQAVPENLEWIGSPATLAILIAATIFETIAYFVPWLDNALDTLTTPAAATVGTIVMASQIPGVDPKVQFGIAAIVGGGTSLAVQLGTVAGRATSTASTGGVANPIITAIEIVAATALTGYLLPGVALFLLAITVPLLIAGGVLVYRNLDTLKKLLD